MDLATNTMETTKLNLAVEMIEETVEYNLKQVSYSQEASDITVWSENTKNGAFHSLSIIPMFLTIGLNCFISYNPKLSRCELKIF